MHEADSTLPTELRKEKGENGPGAASQASALVPLLRPEFGLNNKTVDHIALKDLNCSRCDGRRVPLCCMCISFPWVHVLYLLCTLTCLLQQIPATSPQMLSSKLLMHYVDCFLCCVLGYSVNWFDFARESSCSQGECDFCS